jgi:phage protein D
VAYEDLVPNYQLLISGTEIGTDVTQYVSSVEYEHVDGMADEARISVANPDFALTELKLFQGGSELDVLMGYGSELEFMGRVITRRVDYRFPADEPPGFTVTGYTADSKMMDNSPPEGRERDFSDSKYSDIVERVALRYGFTPDIDPTPDQPAGDGTGKYQKAGTTDYQVVAACANITGFFFWVDFDLDTNSWTLHFKDPARVLEETDQPNLHFKYNNKDLTTLFEFHPAVLLQGASTKMRVAFKDPKTGKRVIEEKEVTEQSGDVQYDGEELGKAEDELADATRIKVFLQDFSFDLPAKKFRSNDEAIHWAEQWFRRNRENFISGRGLVVGVETLRARQIHMLSGLSAQLDGKYYFSKVRHVMSDTDGYSCTFHARKQDSLV